MALPAWYWPPSGLTARTSTIVPFGTGLAVPDWTTPQFFPFSGGVGFGPPIILASGALGSAAAAADGSGGILLAGFTGPAWHITSGGVVTSGALASGLCYVDAAYIGSSGMILAGSGSVRSSGNTQLGTWIGPAVGLQATGTMMATLLPAVPAVGTMTSAGVTGSIAMATSITAPSCIAMVALSGIAVGGWATAPALSGMITALLDPQDQTNMIAVGSGHAIQWRTSGAFSENWFQTQILTGLANLSAMAWRPDGTQMLAPSVISGAVQVIGYSAGLMSLLQTLTISGACAATIAGGSINALIAQSGQAKIATATYTSTWATGTAVTGVTGVTALAPFGLSGAIANYSGGVMFLNLQAGTWSIQQTLNLGYAPTVIATDQFQNVYAAGSGVVSLISPAGALTASGTWTGAAPTAMVVQEGRIVMSVPSDNLFRVFGQSTPNSLTQQASAALALGTTVGLGLSETVMFAMGSGATNMYSFSGSPVSGSAYPINPVTSGVVARWNGSSWTSTALGIGHNPSAITFDVSGNMLVTTYQDTFWSIASGGVVNSSGLVTVFSGQTQTTPIGSATLIYASGHVYVGTCFAGVVVEPV